MTQTTKQAPPKQRTYPGTPRRRICPVCYELTTVYIRTDGQGWEIWNCSSCGCRKDFRTLGRVN